MSESVIRYVDREGVSYREAELLKILKFLFMYFSDLDIALIYTILPFCVFIAPPIVGFFGDKMGNFKR